MRREVVVDENLVGVEDIVVVGVSYATNRLANDFLNVDDGPDGRLLANLRNADFTTHHDHVAFHEGFASNPAFRVDGETRIENCV